MALTLIDTAFKERISPPPIHESIIQSGKATEHFIRFLIDLRKSGGNVYDEINRVITQVNLNIDEINSLQNELDDTQIGAGLDTDGSYIASLVSNYINSATSLNNADLLLDTAIFDNTRELIVSTISNLSLTVNSQTVLCDATSGAINITLPSPSSCFGGNRSLRVSIQKTDTTTNNVTVLPNSTETLVGETSQILNSEGDIFNFITDGTNWYLGA